MRRDEDVSNFEDPALRSAIRRAWSGQTAPPELRHRLAALSTAEAFPPAIRGPWYRHPLFSLAAAAIILIAVGALTMHFAASRPTSFPPPPTATGQPLPENLATYLIYRHDACCKLSDHHGPGLPHDDLKRIAVVLHEKLGYPVMSGEPGKGPWKFDGAAICSVGDVKGAHLIFKEPHVDISIFSLPLSIDPQAANRGPFAMLEDGHPIAGFATKDAFYAVVGSSTDNSLKLSDVMAMCNNLRPTITEPPAAEPSVAEIVFSPLVVFFPL